MHGQKYNNVDKEQNVTDITFHEYDGHNAENNDIKIIWIILHDC